MRVLKIGGNELSSPDFVALLGQNVARLLKEARSPVAIVHGGGRAIADLQGRLGLETEKVDGLRVTDQSSLDAGVDALGVSGVDGGLLRCRKKNHPAADLGYVGEIMHVRRELLDRLMSVDLMPVISPISLGQDGQTYNVNADEAAAAVALACEAEELVFISNVPGVMHDDIVISELNAGEVEDYVAAGMISGGMIPKVRSALDAVNSGVARARITNLAGLLGSGGTAIVAGAGEG
jgi:acetylglutamate kinase